MYAKIKERVNESWSRLVKSGEVTLIAACAVFLERTWPHLETECMLPSIGSPIDRRTQPHIG